MSITWQFEYNSADASIPLESRTYQNKRLLRQVLSLQVTVHSTLSARHRFMLKQNIVFPTLVTSLSDSRVDRCPRRWCGHTAGSRRVAAWSLAKGPDLHRAGTCLFQLILVGIRVFGLLRCLVSYQARCFLSTHWVDYLHSILDNIINGCQAPPPPSPRAEYYIDAIWGQKPI